uniref:DUF4773 domain-containing protein n=1 Tax=Heterorhabditis bacteriophora TaxID=37862 RepID=A0A1I7X970_HETBA
MISDIFAVSIKYNSSSHLKIITDRYRLKVLASEVKMKVITPDFQQDLGGCNCVTRNCACCESIDIPYFHHHLCANISYNARDIGIEVSLGIDGHFYTQEISARNPPPICFAIPGWHDVIGVCMAFTKLDISKKILSGCIDIEAEVLHLRIFRVKLGCFSMPI